MTTIGSTSTRGGMMKGLNELALFAGAGGGLLGSRLLGWRTVCAVEIDEYCQRVLLQRQRDGYLDKFPIWNDVRTFDGAPWRGRVDVVTAGFPCQPFSVAGHRRANKDWRNCWPHTIRIINVVQPTWVLLENVPSLLSRSHQYFGTVLRDLAKVGFAALWGVLSAAGSGAPHIRKRLWIVAYSEGVRLGTRSTGCGEGTTEQTLQRHMADAKHRGFGKGCGGAATIVCPVCGTGKLHYSVASYNGHMHGRCETEGYVTWMQ